MQSWCQSQIYLACSLTWEQAVRVGKEPGIYHSWSECLDQVRGFPKAAFKSFTTLTDAEAFLKDESAGGGGATGKARYCIQHVL